MISRFSILMLPTSIHCRSNRVNIAYSGGLQWDLPFGVLTEDKTGVEWDILLTRDDLGNLLRQFEAVQMASSWFVSFNCDPTQIGELTSVLAENGYVHITPVFWHKEAHTKVSTQQQLTPSVETMVVARKQRSGHQAYTNLHLNPTKRHNFLEGPPQRTYIKDNKGVPLNLTQKPPYVFEWVLERFGNPSNPVLICGTGAGGEVQAAINMGFSVVGIEQDERQVRGLYQFLLTLEAEEEREEQAAEEKRLRLSKKEANKPRRVPTSPALVMAAASVPQAAPAMGQVSSAGASSADKPATLVNEQATEIETNEVAVSADTTAASTAAADEAAEAALVGRDDEKDE